MYFCKRLYCYLLIMDFLFEPAVPESAPMDHFFNQYPFISIASALIMALFAIGVGSLFLKSFWNRLVTDLFNVREIEYQESLSILLILSLFMA